MGDKIKVVIIDDNPNALDLLNQMLVREFNNVEVIATFSKIKDVIKNMPDLKPDLVFLDVQLPGMDGLELLETLSPYTFKVVIVSGFEYYAIPAIKLGVIDYIVKPISRDKLKETFKIFKKSLSAQNQAPSEENMPDGMLAINTIDKVVILNTDDIIRIQSKGAYSLFYLENDTIFASKNLMHYEILLSGKSFCRIHRAHIINMRKLVCIEKDGSDGVCVMKDGSRVLMSTNKKRELMKKLMGKSAPDYEESDDSE